MRTTAVIYVNCDRCSLEQEVLLENETSFDKQVNEELSSRKWLVTDEEDICPKCRKELAINANSTTKTRSTKATT